MTGLLEVIHGTTGATIYLVPQLVAAAYQPDGSPTLLLFNGGAMLPVQGSPKSVMEQVDKLKGTKECKDKQKTQ